MAKDYLEIVLALTICMLASCSEPDFPATPAEGDACLHTVWDMNHEEAELNSHKGEETEGTLQLMYSMRQVIPHSILLAGQPTGSSDYFSCYPRIKKMANGKFIMLYHNGQYGSRIWCTISSDYRTWSAPYMLYEPFQVDIIDTNGKKVSDIRRFVNPDAVVLPSGEILMVCSYRATSHYGDGLDCGLSFRRSTDNGRTWSQPRNLEIGANWEPYLLVLPDGTLHCYYTDAIPQTRNSGTALVISKDDGVTWSEPIRVCAQYKYDYRTEDEGKKKYNGQKIYTDQMPCFRVLNDGKTIAGWLEARLESPTPADCAISEMYNSYCMMSLVRNHSLTWADIRSYDTVKEGPSDRESNVMRGSGGYISTFPSGETVLSSNINSVMSLKLGDCEARRFKGERWTDCLYTPLEYKGYWSSTEVFDQNFLTVAMHTADKGMQLGMMYLNHRIDALHEDIQLDGDASEWNTTRAFYLSAPDGDETIIRACHDESYLYLAVERTDPQIGSQDIHNIILTSEKGKTCSMKVGIDGVRSATTGVMAVAKNASDANGHPGYVCELAVPMAQLGSIPGESVRIYADIVSAGGRFPFTMADPSDQSTWQKINIH